ncbi:hypothetical protein Skr01_54410 [Sphaerisporangium krabiense]|nr:hypothetical protein Skr01_54410 [Sphaerisporangium krabiense]
MVVERLGNPRAGDHDAGVAVARVVRTAGTLVPDDHRSPQFEPVAVQEVLAAMRYQSGAAVCMLPPGARTAPGSRLASPDGCLHL